MSPEEALAFDRESKQEIWTLEGYIEVERNFSKEKVVDLKEFRRQVHPASDVKTRTESHFPEDSFKVPKGTTYPYPSSNPLKRHWSQKEIVEWIGFDLFAMTPVEDENAARERILDVLTHEGVAAPLKVSMRFDEKGRVSYLYLRIAEKEYTFIDGLMGLYY